PNAVARVSKALFAVEMPMMSASCRVLMSIGYPAPCPRRSAVRGIASGSAMSVPPLFGPGALPGSVIV
ncbi:hypothetical protein AB0O91_31915, partial [Kitasatospora sp. NPDC089797]|uniref:hypothetical protein n=1 Tax=Kitasatospora sp. NPDC089797 TaxID=3155298 RepID=UPI00342F8F04